MKMSAQKLTRYEINSKMQEENTKQVILMDGVTKMDRNAMRQFIRTKGISLLDPKIGYVVFKITGNLEPNDEE